jgi:hypothetical protein
MPTPREIKAALAHADGDATPSDLAVLGLAPNSATIAILSAALKDQQQDARGAALEAVAQIFAHVVPPKPKTQSGSAWATGVSRRAIAAMWVIRPAHFGGVSLQAVASSMGVSRQLLDAYAVEFARSFGHRNGAQRPASYVKAKTRTYDQKSNNN